MDHGFFERPILNSPYAYPARHWELDAQGQPTGQIIETRRTAQFITPIPRPRKHKRSAGQERLVFDEGAGVSTATQEYDPTPVINELRHRVNQWRGIGNPSAWGVTPESARLVQHWRHHEFTGVRPFFCQIEAVETAIWLTEVAPNERQGKGFLEHLANANHDANAELTGRTTTAPARWRTAASPSSRTTTSTATPTRAPTRCSSTASSSRAARRSTMTSAAWPPTRSTASAASLSSARAIAARRRASAIRSCSAR